MVDFAQTIAPTQPSPTAPIPGQPPATPEEHASLMQEWNQFLARPDVKAGLAQFGTTMLTNLGTAGGIGQQVGTALGDAGSASMRNTAVNQEALVNAQKNQVERGALEQGGRRIQQEAATAAGQQAVAEEGNRLTAQQIEQRGTLGQQEIDIRQRQLENERINAGNEAAYRQAMLDLEHERNMITAAGTQTPRERAILSSIQQGTAQSQNWALTSDQPFDFASYMKTQMEVIDSQYPPTPGAATPRAEGAGAPPPAGTANPAPAAGMYPPLPTVATDLTEGTIYSTAKGNMKASNNGGVWTFTPVQ